MSYLHITANNTIVRVRPQPPSETSIAGEDAHAVARRVLALPTEDAILSRDYAGGEYTVLYHLPEVYKTVDTVCQRFTHALGLVGIHTSECVLARTHPALAPLTEPQLAALEAAYQYTLACSVLARPAARKRERSPSPRRAPKPKRARHAALPWVHMWVGSGCDGRNTITFTTEDKDTSDYIYTDLYMLDDTERKSALDALADPDMDEEERSAHPFIKALGACYDAKEWDWSDVIHCYDKHSIIVSVDSY